MNVNIFLWFWLKIQSTNTIQTNIYIYIKFIYADANEAMLREKFFSIFFYINNQGYEIIFFINDIAIDIKKYLSLDIVYFLKMLNCIINIYIRKISGKRMDL